MKRIELEQAWPAATPPRGFSERVLERLHLDSELSESAPNRADALGGMQARRARWLALPAVAVVFGGMLLLWPARPARMVDAIATERRIVALGERAVAEMSKGAHLRWSGDALNQEVQQDRGTVSYRVQPGATFRVQTPHGNVTVLGTEFRVVVAESDATGGETMRKQWAIAGVGASLGALLWVGVEQGSVSLSSHGKELVVGAGQAGEVGSDGIPRPKALVPNARADARQVDDRAAERSRSRQVADAIRRHAARRREAARTAERVPVKQPESKPPAKPPTASELPKEEHRFGPYPAGTPAPPAEPDEARRREYVNRTVREQYFPVARSCYDELLEREPTAGGKIVLEFAIVGNGDAGVVDRVAIRDDEDTIDDPEFQLCMRESLYTSVFEPPPSGVEETTVVYPVVLSPD